MSRRWLATTSGAARNEKRLPLDPVETRVDERDLLGVPNNFLETPAAFSSLAAHLEQIGEIGSKRENESEFNRSFAVVADGDTLMGGAGPQIGRANNMQRGAGQCDMPVIENVRIG